MTTLSRRPIQIVEIDVDTCSRTYGSAPCAAVLGTTGVRKCYNTFFTCQDKANYNKTVKTWRLAQNQEGLPEGVVVFPAMAGPVRSNPTQINLGGIGETIGSLGKRAKVSVELQDFLGGDIFWDPYFAGRKDGTAQTDEAGYDPETRGTHLGKLRRRFPYYIGRPLRVKEGYVGQALASMRTRHYIIQSWSGPDVQGKTTIEAMDVLALADNSKAQCPVASRGELAADIDETELATFDLQPASIGAEYPASGRASIGSEIVTFTRSGDAITLTARGVDGSEASDHGIGDLFQTCYHVSAMPIYDVVADLLENYAGVDASMLPTGDWQAEVDRWMAGYRLTATVAKPTGVTTLLAEIMPLGVFIWADDIANEIKMRANRPVDLGAGETVKVVTDDAEILEGTLGNTELYEKRLSQAQYWHGVIDASADPKESENYRKASLHVDPTAGSTNEYNQSALYTHFNRWLGPAGDDAIVDTTVRRMVNRYRNPPRQVTFDIDVKDEATIRVADVIQVTSRVIQDETGRSLPLTMQVASVEEIETGNRLRIVAQEWEFGIGRFGFVTENTRGDYSASSDAERELGTYFVDGGTLVFPDGAEPYVFF